MHGKSKVQYFLKLLFITIQLILFLFSISLLTIFISICLKTKNYISIDNKIFMIVIVYSLLTNLISVIGIIYIVNINNINKDYKDYINNNIDNNINNNINKNINKNYIYFVYIVLCLILMNMQLMIISKGHDLVINAPLRFDKWFEIMSNEDKKVVEDILDCNNDKNNCEMAVIRISEGVREKGQVVVFAQFFLESLCVALILFFRMLRNNKKIRI
ncbi:hypothetical protein DMUE_4931 [Dictyocoela muelleri]|nr:hypothetical protein DMUE_4931 [Dictyocoela muelleri]